MAGKEECLNFRTISEALAQASPSHARDEPIVYSDRKRQIPFLEILHSPRGDRQRKSYLRDSFIETYPRNGNVNGLTTSVPAIPSARYLDPTSVLLTNANGKNLAANNKLATASHTTERAPSITCRRHSHCDNGAHQPSTYTLETNCSKRNNCINQVFCSALNQNNVKCLIADKICSRDVIGSILRPTVKCEQREPKKDQFAMLNLKVSESIPYCFSRNTSTDTKDMEINENYENNYLLTRKYSNKKRILNQVLQNPWNPLAPINFRPFRRKVIELLPFLPETYEDNGRTKPTINDNNNNYIRVAPPTSNIPLNLNLSPNSHSNNAGDFKCDVCSKIFLDKAALTSHIKSHSTGTRYSCSECSKTFSQLRNFKYHMSVHRGTREFAATCTVCGKYFNDRGYLSSHMKIHRNRKEYKCPMCPKSFNQRVAYNMHVRIHTGIKPHVCDQCGKAFSRKMLLKQHQRTHSGERPYACAHCAKRFADRSNMSLHLRLHTGVKPFSCTLCSKSFTKKHHLKSHLNFHTGAKPYSCPHCGLAFTQSSNMRTHMKKCINRQDKPH